MTTRDLAQLYRQAGKPAPPEVDETPLPSKMRNVKKEVDGHVFDSTGEAEAYKVLKLWERFGVIEGLTLQPEYTLQEKAQGRRAIAYRADFTFWDIGRQKQRWVDYKGFKTAVFRLKFKLMAEKFPDIEIELWDRATVREYARGL